MVVQGELPHEHNRRGGPGWWMDLDGVWRAPEEWPEDYPPLDGWIRSTDGTWGPPRHATALVEDPPIATIDTPPEPQPAPKQESRQAAADRRAMYTVAGVVGGAMILLVGALIVITQAGASDDGTTADATPEVIFAAETDADRVRRLREAANAAPALAREQLDTLATRDAANLDADDDVADFDPLDWLVTDAGCLDLAEQVFVARSAVPIGWADNLECVPDSGRWTDRNLGTVIDSTLDGEVVHLVPPKIAHASGAYAWDSATRSAYAADMGHPATLQIVAADTGFNPRQQDPASWRPGSETAWCAYAIDWIAVKVHWSLDVHPAERAALEDMLDTCDAPSSAGADPATIVVEPLAQPDIVLATSAS